MSWLRIFLLLRKPRIGLSGFRLHSMAIGGKSIASAVRMALC